MYFNGVSLCLMIALLTGCSTSTLVENDRDAEVKITNAGEIVYREQTITEKQIPDLLRDDNVKRGETIHILVPLEQEQRNYQLMRSIADTLKQAGYGRIVFTTQKKAIGKLKEAAPVKP